MNKLTVNQLNSEEWIYVGYISKKKKIWKTGFGIFLNAKNKWMKQDSAQVTSKETSKVWNMK